jgi:arginase
VRLMPDALRARGLRDRIEAADGGRIVAPPYSFDIDPDIQVRNAAAISAYSRQLADALTPFLDNGMFPLVLGGDCSILLASGLALKRRGRHGLVFIDGHQDLLTPRTSHSKGAAGMDLALACGVGPRSLTVFDGLTPLFESRDVLMLGDRSGDAEYPDQAVAPVRDAMFRANLEQWRAPGIAKLVQDGLSRLRRQGVDHVWIHVDADVLDDAIMPAVDSRQPGGLSWREFHDALVELLLSGMSVGMQLTIYDPTQDGDGACAEALVTALERAFRDARRR